MSDVWKHSKARGTLLLLLLALADFANDNGVAYPSLRTLAEKTRAKVRSVQYLLKRLQTSGELQIKHGAGPHGCNLFRVTVGVQSIAPVQSVAPGVQRVAPLVQAHSSGGAISAQKGVQLVAPKPSVNRHRTVTKKESELQSNVNRTTTKSGAPVYIPRQK